jgi:hypothetical protein
MFAGPEYASYVALCRELRLERALQDGDFVDDGVRPGVQVCGVTVAPGVMWHGGVWIPRLDQWLAMLEEAGADQVLVERVEPNDDYGPGGYICFTVEDGHDGLSRLKPEYEGGWPGFYALCRPTPEEAAAQLWRAVTGRTVPA